MHHDRIAVLILLSLVLVVASIKRNVAWHSLLALWTDCAAKSPGKSRTHNNLGNCYLLLGKHFPAIAEYRKAVELDDKNMEAHYNLAIELDHVGLYAQAVKHHDIFCRNAASEYAAQRTASCKRVQEIYSDEGKRSPAK